MTRLSSSYLLCLTICLLFSSVYGFCPMFLRNQTACTCTDYVDGAIIKCSGPNGPLVVEELKKVQTEVRELTLSNANIVEIGSRAFKNLRIKKLVLDNNRIKNIQKDAFRGLESVLQELYINNNRLSAVPTEALEGLRSLNVLSLRCNEIGNLTESVFQNNPGLIEVNLGCNKIQKIDSSSFSEVKNSMQNIILDSNFLRYIPTAAVEGMQFLIALHIKYNNIEKLGKNELRNLTSLSMLTLTGNSISHISKKFVDNVPNLRYISLGENDLSNIEIGTMKQFSSAEIIDLSHNNLPEITVDLFSGMENLQHLNLEGNSIKEIASGAFATTPLLLLWLPHNCITSVTPTMFQGTPFLKQVSFAYNNIRNIQAFSFAHLANLHTLDMSNNKIQFLQPSAILGSDFLTVRLQENPFVCSQDGFHVMNGREAINLTTEANVICKTDYAHDKTDKCPQKLNKPTKPMCCNDVHERVTTTTLPPTTTTFLPTTVMSKNETAFEKTTTKEVTIKEEPTTTEVLNAIQRAALRAKKLNINRFHKLQHRPKNMTMMPHINVAVDPVEANLQAEELLRRAKNAEAKQIENFEKTKNSGAINSGPATEFNKDSSVETVQKKDDQMIVARRT